MNAAQALGLAIGLLFFVALLVEEHNKRGPPARTEEDVLEEVTLIDDFEDELFEEEG